MNDINFGNLFLARKKYFKAEKTARQKSNKMFVSNYNFIHEIDVYWPSYRVVVSANNSVCVSVACPRISPQINANMHANEIG
jgi:hypothetical protein